MKTQSAVPALIEIVNQNISATSQFCALSVLGSAGPLAKEAVPSLLGWATNANAEARRWSIDTLACIHVNPDRVLPVLTNAMHDPVFIVRLKAVTSLENFGTDARVAVPALLEFINAPQNSELRNVAISTLKNIDPEAAAKAGITNTP
jgi:HEAT repeat protein